jgi:hypothetical protein
LAGRAQVLIQVLLSHGVLLAQRLPALGGALGQTGAGRGLRARRDGLGQFLIDLGRREFGEQFAFLYRTADILDPTHDIPVAARINRRFDDPQQCSGQSERLAIAPRFGCDRGDVLFCVQSGGGLQCAGLEAAQHEYDHAADQQNTDNPADDELGAPQHP